MFDKFSNIKISIDIDALICAIITGFLLCTGCIQDNTGMLITSGLFAIAARIGGRI